MFIARVSKMKVAAVASLFLLTGGLGLVPNAIDTTPEASAKSAPYSGKYPPKIKNGFTIYTKSKVAVYTNNWKIAFGTEKRDIVWVIGSNGGLWVWMNDEFGFGGAAKGSYVLIDG